MKLVWAGLVLIAVILAVTGILLWIGVGRGLDMRVGAACAGIGAIMWAGTATAAYIHTRRAA